MYVDEFQSFANESFADILSEAPVYKLSLTIAHQYIEQMSEEVRAAVFGNVGTMVTFRVGAFDAEVLEKEFAPVFTAEDLVNLGFVQIYLKLMIDGVSSQPFSASTLPPIKKPDVNHRDDVIEHSRKVLRVSVWWLKKQLRNGMNLLQSRKRIIRLTHKKPERNSIQEPSQAPQMPRPEPRPVQPVLEQNLYNPYRKQKYINPLRFLNHVK